MDQAETILIWADGACSGNPGPGGWAFVKTLGGEHRGGCGGEKDTTNQRMELAAVAEALASITEKSAHRPVVVHSDSAYVVNGMTQNWVAKWQGNGWRNSEGKEVANQDLWLRLVGLVQFRDGPVQFVKVKAHTGQKDANAFVDAMARRACATATKKGTYSRKVGASDLAEFPGAARPEA